MKIDWTPKNLIIAAAGIIGLLLVLPKLGDGLDWVAKVVKTTAVAYAAKEKVDTVDTQFQQYLAKQDATATAQQAAADAIKSYIQQQQQQMPNQAVPRGLQEWDDQGVCWTCSTTDRERCFNESLWRHCE